MVKTLVLIPVVDNDGVPFAEDDWQALESRLLRFGGFSLRAGVEGVWEAGGRIYRDRSREYTVALTSWWLLPAWLDVVDWARAHFRQVALYVEVAGSPEVRDG